MENGIIKQNTLIQLTTPEGEETGLFRVRRQMSESDLDELIDKTESEWNKWMDGEYEYPPDRDKTEDLLGFLLTIL